MEESGYGYTEETLRYPYSFGNVDLDCVSVNILAVLQCYTLMKCLPLEELGKNTRGLSLLFLLTLYQSIILP